MATRLALVSNLLVLLILAAPSLAQQPIAGGASLTSGEWQTPLASESQPAVGEAGSCCPPCRPSACCVPVWSVFGEGLYLRPGNDKVAFGVAINGAIEPPSGVAPVQVAPEGVVDHEFEPGFRAGLRHAVDDCATMGVTYTHFDSVAEGGLHVTSPNVIRSLVVHPGTQTASTDFLDATARGVVQFRLGDMDYRRLIACDDLYAVHYLIGGRYASMGQEFSSLFTNSTLREMIGTQIDFEGGGIRLGLEGERHARCSGWMLYGRSAASFVGGVYRADYYQRDSLRGLVVNTGWKEDRIITILDLELGVGWTSSCGRFRVSAGYMVNAWLNTLGTEDFIQAVQNNTSGRSSDLTNAMTFDGLTTHVEYRF